MTRYPALLFAGLSLLSTSPARSAAPSPLDERVSIDLVDADPGDALHSFSRLTGLKFTIDPGIKAQFTARLKNVRVRTALDVLCESVNCTWQEVAGEPPTVRVTGPQRAESRPPLDRRTDIGLDEPITISLKDASAADVLKSVGQILEVEVAAPRFEGSVNIEIQAAPVRKVLDELCRQLQCGWQLDTSGEAAVLRFSPAAPP